MAEMTKKTSSGSAKVTLPTDEQILITREFDAPRHLVYRAWTTPELVERWWSGHRGTMTSVEIDLRVGGRWRYVLVANGGFEVAFHGEYREIVPNERIVTTEMYEDPDAEAPNESAAPVNTVTFTEVDGRTILTLLVQTTSKELRDAILDSGMEVGMQEQMDVLAEIAASLR
ncbi:Uncharacterized conserved protein YndB, AHSA1/START domain [Amycolatopsis arida]|uniref:Uncharacterized conserved protein YndB, AHSA1/START domain n=1 Tax=Amycolatopsis arida TaxID=587909 RepID=A0A1I5YBP3_9PSEU|nr:SRPBCC family protein [Amycolatopsis arida]TDX90409.1 uncharacterized protein YndB with AHSA1/START domain [Amycolatopsis arida]SFQ41632.1 Uncharacterized conserved protein YndB, AHSA1/START domain [Amycolatopsis arida]